MCASTPMALGEPVCVYRRSPGAEADLCMLRVRSGGGWVVWGWRIGLGSLECGLRAGLKSSDGPIRREGDVRVPFSEKMGGARRAFSKSSIICAFSLSARRRRRENFSLVLWCGSAWAIRRLTTCGRRPHIAITQVHLPSDGYEPISLSVCL